MRNGIRNSRSSEEITKQYNEDHYDPIDGELVNSADKFSAFLEAYVSQELGIVTPQMKKAQSIMAENFPEGSLQVLAMKHLYREFMQEKEESPGKARDHAAVEGLRT